MSAAPAIPVTPMTAVRGDVHPLDAELMDALPIPAGILTMKGGRLWFEACNRHLFAIASDDRGWDVAHEAMKKAEQGPLGDFIRAFLADPDHAPCEADHHEGDAFARTFLAKLAPLSPRGGVNRCLLTLVDRTQEVRADHSLRQQMVRDTLTGLPNRLSFTEALDGVIDGARHEGRYVLLLDLMRFARINESMGSLTGDELLISAASRLVGAMSEDDYLARTGANEFALLALVDEEAGETAEDAAQRLRHILIEPFELSDLEIRVDCALGIAPLDPKRTGEEILRNAQFAAKLSKTSGLPTRYEPSEAKAARRRFSIETELRRAIERDELKLEYQPLVDLASGRVTGFEALARWHHEDRGDIGPSEFIPVAEESGLILDLGRWAMDNAARTLAAWDRAEGRKLPLTLSVNLSAIQVARDDLSTMVGEALRHHKIGGDRLTLELTETAIVQDPARAQKVFEGLKALDSNLAMDDFGTGYSSLAYLQRLPIDLLKIDQRFIRDMLSDADSVAIVRAILGLASALGMRTTAEGIESAELATTLAALGCASGQGFHFSKAVPAKRALTYWRAREEKAAREAKIPAPRL